jgi:hemin uptake protein HemP
MSAPACEPEPPARDEADGVGAAVDPTLPRIDSAELLRGARAAYIVHNGVTYRLSTTRAGKLILTK